MAAEGPKDERYSGSFHVVEVAADGSAVPMGSSGGADDKALDDAGLQQIRELFVEYKEFLMTMGCDISLFQGFDAELAGLPGAYSREEGGWLCVGREGDSSGGGTPPPPVACIALRRCGDEAEAKRLYVRPKYRLRGVGRWLSRVLMHTAHSLGYRSIVLDTLERLPAAEKMYADLGFQRCEAYRHNPLDDAVYMRLKLGDEPPDEPPTVLPAL